MWGRGPIIDMSPRTTFHSCGSSSSDDRRRNFPIGVIRGSSADACRVSASLLTYIERNFMKVEIFAVVAGPFLTENTPPGEVTAIQMATTIHTGASATIASSAKSTSNILFNALCIYVVDLVSDKPDRPDVPILDSLFPHCIHYNVNRI